MRKIFTISLLLFLLTFSTKLSAQFTATDIKFWVGEGSASSIFVVDFRDGTSDPSFAFGFHYGVNDNFNFADMIQAVADAEPNFAFNQSDMGFLENIFYNNHSALASHPDWWSTWSGDNLEEMYMNQGTSELLIDGRWYGVSYGFMPETAKPTVTYPAYSSQWFSSDNVGYWIGEGQNKSVVVLDFNLPGEAPVTYAWGVRYNGNITAKDALILIAQMDSGLDITIANDIITSVTYYGLSGNVTDTNSWKLFKGTDMSDWVKVQNLNSTLANNQWFGATFGTLNTRRPFIPTAAQENTAGIGHNNKITFIAYPNPVRDVLNLKSEEIIKSSEVINITGQKVKTFANTSQLDFSDLTEGVYLVKVYTDSGMATQKVIKQ